MSADIALWIDWAAAFKWGPSTISYAHQEPRCAQKTGWFYRM